ncbi:MAG: transmembrane anchor protein [Gemmatimonadota bacterium]
MHIANTPPESELPTSRALVRSTLIAAAAAAVLLVTVVLPAEYGVDPTGVGRVLGLTEMGEIKMALAKEAEADAASDAAGQAERGALETSGAPVATAPASASPAAPAAASAASSDTTVVALQPGQGREIKVVMREGARVNYEWTVEGGVVNSDTHADRPGTPYHGYAKGRNQASDQGVLVAAFDGKHGWFWRNRGQAPVTVTLRTSGDYQELQEVK